MADEQTKQESAWCPVADVMGDGTMHFAGGTEVYVLPIAWGDGVARIRVLGRHRDTGKVVSIVMPSKKLVNWRAREVTDPRTVDRLGGADGWSKDQVDRIVAQFG